MNILIVTPLEPMATLEVYLNCINHMHFDSDIFFSIPAMALLGEETLQDSHISYEKLLNIFLHSFLKTDFGKKIKDNKGYNVCVGTTLKNINNFDYIVAMIPPYLQNEDYCDPIGQNIKNIYTIKDADLTFPTYHHLEKFLDLCALPRKKEDTKGE